MNELAKHNEARLREVIRLRDIIRKRRAGSPVPCFGDYPLNRLRERITQVLLEQSGQADVTWELDFLDRSKFGADLAVRLTGLLKRYGAKEYIASHVPWIAEALASPGLADIVAEVTRKGIYVNVRLVDHW
ncbi:MAG: hypothetical protein ACRDTT_34505, partial [Pseudonocardiaceae bacterium]